MTRQAERASSGPRLARAFPLLVLALTALALPAASAPKTGLTAAPVVARAYDAVLDADFDRMPEVLTATCGPAPPVACLGLDALALWWEIQLDPTSRALDGRFSRKVDAAITEAARWAAREPDRAEAWFYLGAALGVRGQWKVLREERLSAARDGKRIRDALERALALDPTMRDADFGIGVYRYYAAVAPAYLRWLRWLLFLPGGNRAEGLAAMERASREALLVRAEAQYQLHVVYLWYEQRARDARQLVVGLQSRYPRNPLFWQIEADIDDLYLHDANASLAASERLLARARGGQVNRASMAEIRARLNIAVQLERLGQRDRARAEVDAIIAAQPKAPADALTRARALRRRLDRR
jgi:hypothetical protein